MKTRLYVLIKLGVSYTVHILDVALPASDVVQSFEPYHRQDNHQNTSDNHLAVTQALQNFKDTVSRGYIVLHRYPLFHYR